MNITVFTKLENGKMPRLFNFLVTQPKVRKYLTLAFTFVRLGYGACIFGATPSELPFKNRVITIKPV